MGVYAREPVVEGETLGLGALAVTIVEYKAGALEHKLGSIGYPGSAEAEDELVTTCVGVIRVSQVHPPSGMVKARRRVRGCVGRLKPDARALWALSGLKERKEVPEPGLAV